MPDYVAVPHLAYNWIVAVYFFLGGLGAGAFLLSVTATYWWQELKPVARTASVLAPIAIAAGLFCLWLDLGQPFRVWRLFLSFNPTAAISYLSREEKHTTTVLGVVLHSSDVRQQNRASQQVAIKVVPHYRTCRNHLG